jgi:hypothetical protein
MREQLALTQTQPMSFSQQELDDTLTKCGDAVAPPLNVKAITLGLVHLKRLDLGAENGVKVFKVRRFY